MASRKIDDLDIKLAAKCLDLIAVARQAGIDLLVTCTYRDNSEQAELYARGRTKPGFIVTHAKPGQSLHNHEKNGRPAAHAFDIVPLVNGKPLWETEGRAGQIWEAIGQLGEAQGLEWGGRWKGEKCDRPHFQLREGDRKNG